MTTVTPPALRVVTRPLTRVPHLMGFADPVDPLVWVRHHRGIVGRGVAHRFDAYGDARFDAASHRWATLQDLAQVDDPIGGPATGLIGLGTFTFAGNSQAPSTLIVPTLVVGKKDGAAWVTAVSSGNGSGRESAAAAVEWLMKRSVVNVEELPDLYRLAGLEPSGSSTATWESLAWEEPAGEAEAYRTGVARAAEHLEAGDLEKVVLSRRLRASLPEGADLTAPLTRLTKRYLDCWTYAVDGMLGSSPETLIRSIHGRVSARVLAGTRRRASEASRDEALSEELMSSRKERFEHELAVLSLMDTLAPHVTDLTRDAEPYLLQLPNVWHLATNVRAQLADGADAFELARAVHPTAAVAGTPTPDAIAMIDRLEPFDRGRYAGAVGWVGAGGNGDWAIALRGGQVETVAGVRSLTAYAGGGLVVGADPEHEFAETVSKFRPLIEACS